MAGSVKTGKRVKTGQVRLLYRKLRFALSGIIYTLARQPDIFCQKDFASKIKRSAEKVGSKRCLELTFL